MSKEDLIGSIGLPEIFSQYCQFHQNDSHLPFCYLDFYFWLWTIFNENILKQNIEKGSFVLKSVILMKKIMIVKLSKQSLSLGKMANFHRILACFIFLEVPV